MPISHQYKCIFVHIPRTGGSSIEHALKIFGVAGEEKTLQMFGRIKPGVRDKYSFLSNYYQHLTATNLKRILSEKNWNGYFKFAFVRNPWERMVSFYFNKDPDLIDEARQQGINLADTTFEEFLSRIKQVNHVYTLEQHKFIINENGKLIVDFVGRFEDLGNDFKKIYERIGIHAKLGHYNRSVHKPYREYFNDETKEITRKMYEKDIEVFQYEF